MVRYEKPDSAFVACPAFFRIAYFVMKPDRALASEEHETNNEAA